MIWLGGAVPARYMPTILRVSAIAKRSHYNFTLLVDKNIDFYRSAVNCVVAKKIISSIKLLTCDDFLLQLHQSAFFSGTAENISRYHNFVKYCLSEGIGLKNLAAKADWLRYAWLEQHGGLYLDVDTDILTNLHAPSWYLQNNRILPYGISLNEEYTYDYSSDSSGKKHRRYKRIKFTANDIIACAAGHPVLRCLINKMIDWSNKFLLFDDFRQFIMSEHLTSCHCTHPAVTVVGDSLFDKKRIPSMFSNFTHMVFAKPNRSELTLLLSGPAMLGEVLNSWLESISVGLSDRARFIGLEKKEDSLRLFGVQLISNSHLNWCQQVKPPKAVECHF